MASEAICSGLLRGHLFRPSRIERQFISSLPLLSWRQSTRQITRRSEINPFIRSDPFGSSPLARGVAGESEEWNGAPMTPYRHEMEMEPRSSLPPSGGLGVRAKAVRRAASERGGRSRCAPSGGRSCATMQTNTTHSAEPWYRRGRRAEAAARAGSVGLSWGPPRCSPGWRAQLEDAAPCWRTAKPDSALGTDRRPTGRRRARGAPGESRVGEVEADGARQAAFK